MMQSSFIEDKKTKQAFFVIYIGCQASKLLKFKKNKAGFFATLSAA
jgi:hypothetical protein